MRSLPVVLAIGAAMFYIAGATDFADYLALLLLLGAVILGAYEWVFEPERVPVPTKEPPP